MNLVAIRAAVRLELSDDGALWTDGEIDRSVSRVTEDISRLVPLEKVKELTYEGDKIEDEAFTSAYGTAVSLTYSAIKPKSESVDDGSGTTYTRDTDYTMDYWNGTITVLSGGSMADSTEYYVTYTKSPLVIDISSLTDLIAPSWVEWPVGQVPLSRSSFQRWGNYLHLLTRGQQSQAALADGDHIRIYYKAQHTAPITGTSGTFPRFLDEVLVAGTAAYCLFIKHRERNLQAVTDIALARAELSSIDRTEIESALDALKIASTGVYDKLDVALAAIAGAGGPYVGTAAALNALSTATTGPYDRINTALANIDTLLKLIHDTGAGTGDLVKAENVWTVDEPGEADHIEGPSGPSSVDKGAQEYLEAGDDEINTVTVGQQVPERYIQYAQAELAIAGLYANRRRDFLREAELHLGQARGYIEETQAWAIKADRYIAEAAGFSTWADKYLREAASWAQKGQLYIEEANSRLAQIDRTVAEAEGFFNSASYEMLVSDRFLSDARERTRDYWEILKARVQQMHQEETLVATQQWPTPIRRTLMPTGDES